MPFTETTIKIVGESTANSELKKAHDNALARVVARFKKMHNCCLPGMPLHTVLNNGFEPVPHSSDGLLQACTDKPKLILQLHDGIIKVSKIESLNALVLELVQRDSGSGEMIAYSPVCIGSLQDISIIKPTGDSFILTPPDPTQQLNTNSLTDKRDYAVITKLALLKQEDFKIDNTSAGQQAVLASLDITSKTQIQKQKSYQSPSELTKAIRRIIYRLSPDRR